ncbi:hypothetical protein LXL04_027147 [Taraxacum kok-saghyz]
MDSHNKKKPAASPNNQAVDDSKLTKIGIGWMMASTTANGGTQKDVTVDWEIVEFTKEEEVVDVEFNDKFEGKTFKDLVNENDLLHIMLDSSERNRKEAESTMKLKEEDLKSTISKLENNISSLKQSLAIEESQKLDAIDQLKKQKEANTTLKKDQDSLKEELQDVKQYSLTAYEKVKEHEDTYKRWQEYNKSLQQYNTKLQNEIKTTTDANKHVEKEKATLLENHTTLKKLLEDEVKEKATSVKEVQVLRGELQRVNEDRELLVSLIKDLNAEVIRYKESTGRTAAEYANLKLKFIPLENTCSTQREQIALLRIQLDDAIQKLKELKGKSIW